MLRGLNRTLTAVVVVGAVLVVPSAALADGCGGGPSAAHVYTECLSNGGGGKSTGHGGGGSGSGGTNAGGGSSTSVPVSPQTAKALKKAGQDGKALSSLVRRFGGRRLLQSSGSAPATEPTAVGSAFDVGSGPTALLIVLAGSAILLLAASGYRGVRQRRH